jgi:DMSO reductase anchor subunit
MYWLTIIEICGVSCFSAYLIQNYCKEDISLPVKALALLAWIMNFAIIGCVPLDIYITLRNAETNSDPLDDPAYVTLATLYQILYWGLFLLCWTLIPLVSEYTQSVDFDPNDRIKRSLMSNAKFFAMIVALGFIFIVYILVTG